MKWCEYSLSLLVDQYRTFVIRTSLIGYRERGRAGSFEERSQTRPVRIGPTTLTSSMHGRWWYVCSEGGTCKRPLGDGLIQGSICPKSSGGSFPSPSLPFPFPSLLFSFSDPPYKNFQSPVWGHLQPVGLYPQPSRQIERWVNIWNNRRTIT